ncbi:MAG TPA: phosphate ABC transporter substrate-binding protein [Verrucomicrobiae bacterium]|nr:phosphate ABC transporter substrate-binding protein [Verrucomicrobiae bacterium]
MRINLYKKCSVLGVPIMGLCLKGLGVLALGMLFASCSPSETAAPGRSDKSGAIVLSGSNTIGEELAPRLIGEYKKDHPAATFQTEFKGTGYGVAAMLGGLSDIAAASRVLTTNELELARSRNVSCNDYIIGSYSVAVIVNAANSVGNLTRDQIRDIFTGAIQNWKEVGGPDGPIHLYIRDPISGTHLGFRELAMENKPYGVGMKPLTSYSSIVQSVAVDAGGIGYCSIELSTKPNVKAVSIGGIAPTAAMVNQGQYPYARALHLFTDKEKEAPAAHDFIQFVQSSTGQKLLDQMGFIPHP